MTKGVIFAADHYMTWAADLNPEQTKNRPEDRCDDSQHAEDDGGDGVEQRFGQIRQGACCNDRRSNRLRSAATWPD